MTVRRLLPPATDKAMTGPSPPEGFSACWDYSYPQRVVRLDWSPAGHAWAESGVEILTEPGERGAAAYYRVTGELCPAGSILCIELPEPIDVRGGKARGEKADGYSGGKYHRHLKRAKARAERRRAKQNPECVPGYNKHNGWEL